MYVSPHDEVRSSHQGTDDEAADPIRLSTGHGAQTGNIQSWPKRRHTHITVWIGGNVCAASDEIMSDY